MLETRGEINSSEDSAGVDRSEERCRNNFDAIGPWLSLNPYGRNRRTTVEFRFAIQCDSIAARETSYYPERSMWTKTLKFLHARIDRNIIDSFFCCFSVYFYTTINLYLLQIRGWTRNEG